MSVEVGVTHYWARVWFGEPGPLPAVFIHAVVDGERVGRVKQDRSFNLHPFRGPPLRLDGPWFTA